MKQIDKDLLVEWLKGKESYQELLLEIEKGSFDNKDYRNLSQAFIGSRITDFFCNGFFGSSTYDLRGAVILRVFEQDDDTITIEVRKLRGDIDYAYFYGGWNEWENVYEYLNEWTNEEELSL